MDEVECIVVGAGVIGLAVARALALAGREVIVLEAAGSIGTEISSRNSEVIHAGMYYPPGSLKARACVDGRRRLYRYCAEHKVPHRPVGKLIVATAADELPVLGRLQATAAANGLAGDEALRLLDAEEAKRLEPQLACVAALLSPATGIVDSHALMLAYQCDAEAHGAMIAFRTALRRATPARGRIVVETAGADGGMQLACRWLINCAGLAAQRVAAAVEGMPAEHIPPLYPVKGCYFTLAGRSPFRRLIYPVPVHAGLGVHVTIDMAGQVRFGPDTEYVERLDYDVPPARADSFYAAVRRYWPGLKAGALQPGYAGIRPKLQGPQDGPKDFVIQGPAEHGVSGLVNLFGIESPGLTASLHLGDLVAGRLD